MKYLTLSVSRKILMMLVFSLFLSPAVIYAEESGAISVIVEDENKKGRNAKKYVRKQTLGVRKMNEDALDLVEQRKYDEALSIYFRALDRVEQKRIKDPGFKAELLNNIAQAYYQKGFFNSFSFSNNEPYVKAVEFASQSVLVQEDYWPAYVTLADVFYKMKDYEKVDHFYSKAEEYIAQDDKEYPRIEKRHNLVKRILEKERKKAEKNNEAE